MKKESQQLYIWVYIHVFLCNVWQGFSLVLHEWFIRNRDTSVFMLPYPFFSPFKTRVNQPRTLGSKNVPVLSSCWSVGEYHLWLVEWSCCWVVTTLWGWKQQLRLEEHEGCVKTFLSFRAVITLRADLGIWTGLCPASVALTRSSSSLSWDRPFLENLWQISGTFMAIVSAVVSGVIKCAEKH